MSVSCSLLSLSRNTSHPLTYQVNYLLVMSLFSVPTPSSTGMRTPQDRSLQQWLYLLIITRETRVFTILAPKLANLRDTACPKGRLVPQKFLSQASEEGPLAPALTLAVTGNRDFKQQLLCHLIVKESFLVVTRGGHLLGWLWPLIDQFFI